MKNQLKTIFLFGVLSALLVSIGGLVGGRALPVFLVLAIAMNLGAWLFSDKLVLRMSGARLLGPDEFPALHSMVADLAQRAGIPAPRLAIVADPTPNAFATGRSPSRAVVAVTEGLLRLVDPRELRGVLAHELAHVRNRDTLVASIAAAAATVVSYVGNTLQFAAMFGGGSQNEEEGSTGGGLAAAILAPIGATMLQMGISRSREYLADEWAARLTGEPEALASALGKLQRIGETMVAHGGPSPAPATASLAIVNPLAGRSVFRWFATHPPIEDRIARLLDMAQPGFLRTV
ncbi:MAG: M48 family metalloprotease [Planctomycetes bacterium]|nr:M48 family metalloprotease [Planctomycetota bacterium]